MYGGIFCLETLSDLWYNRGMPITEYSGENLLQNEIIQKIQKEADLLRNVSPYNNQKFKYWNPRKGKR